MSLGSKDGADSGSLEHDAEEGDYTPAVLAMRRTCRGEACSSMGGPH